MSQTTPNPELAFTGERFTPECLREMAYEHWHRYALAGTLTKGRKVLDAACGEGYGTALLARSAASVDGIDLSSEAISHASLRYPADNIRFLSASVTSIPASDNAYNAIVSFETLEHLREQSAMLREFSRVLSDDGFLIISSPDKATYSDATGYVNEFHVKELYREELVDLLQDHFPVVQLLGQALAFQSLVWPVRDQNIATNSSAEGAAQSLVLADGQIDVTRAPTIAPLYYLALCARSQAHLPKVPALSGFSDQAQSVYAHYQHEIRKNMAAGKLLAERDAEIEQLKARLDGLDKKQDSHGI